MIHPLAGRLEQHVAVHEQVHHVVLRHAGLQPKVDAVVPEVPQLDLPGVLHLHHHEVGQLRDG
jgi:hypothetical protein